jgi:hypothetical protein
MLPFENKSCASLYRPVKNKQPFYCIEFWKEWTFSMPSILQVTGSPL